MKFFISAGLIFLLVVILAVGGSFYFFLNTPQGFGLLVRAVWARIIPSVKLASFSVEKVRTSPFEGLEVSGLQMKFSSGGVKTNVKAEKLGVEPPPGLALDSPVFWFENLSLKNKDVSARNAELKFGLKPMQATPTGFGSLAIGKLTAQKRYKLRQIQGVITRLNPLTLAPVEGKFLDGTLHAEVTFTPDEGKLSVRGTLTDGDLSQLAAFGGGQFKNSRGRFQGEFRFEAEGDRIRTLWISLASPRPGGEMNAELFRILLDYLPSNADKKRVQELIETRNTVPFDEAHFTLKNAGEKSFRGRLDLASKTLALNLELSLEINFEDAAMMKLISNILQIFGGPENETTD